MPLSTKTMRGLIRYLPGAGQGKGAAVERLVVWPSTTSPVYGSHIRPTAAPSGTAAAGDFYVNSTTGQFHVSNGTSFIPATEQRVVKDAVTVLTAADSGALCVWLTAAGYLFTLPAPQVGLWFDFLVRTTITSVGAKVITDAGTSFITGSFLQIPDTAAQAVYHLANPAATRAWNGNGTTTGGYSGDNFRLTCISTTLWAISGVGLATGTEATPFAAS